MNERINPIRINKIFDLYNRGFNQKQISNELGISEKTVSKKLRFHKDLISKNAKRIEVLNSLLEIEFSKQSLNHKKVFKILKSIELLKKIIKK